MPVDHCPVSWRVRVQAQAYLSPSYVLQHGDAVLVSAAANLLAHRALYAAFHDDKRCVCVRPLGMVLVVGRWRRTRT
jgi:hypothetical protein